MTNKEDELQIESTDEELMRRYQDGDFTAFTTLYSRLNRKVFGYLLARLDRNRTVASDVHQAVFLKMHQSRSQYRTDYPVLQWVFVIAHSCLVDHFRKSARSVSEYADYPLENLPAENGDSSEPSELPSLEGLV